MAENITENLQLSFLDQLLEQDSAAETLTIWEQMEAVYKDLAKEKIATVDFYEDHTINQKIDSEKICGEVTDLLKNGQKTFYELVATLRVSADDLAECLCELISEEKSIQAFQQGNVRLYKLRKNNSHKLLRREYKVRAVTREFDFDDEGVKAIRRFRKLMPGLANVNLTAPAHKALRQLVQGTQYVAGSDEDLIINLALIHLADEFTKRYVRRDTEKLIYENIGNINPIKDEDEDEGDE